MIPENKISGLIQDKWFFSTNTQNLNNFIAQGLITEPCGMQKYYRDILEDYLGWVPLFRKKLPKDVLEKGRSENQRLSLCVLECSLDNISGSVKALRNNSGMGAEYEVIEYNLGDSSVEQSSDIDIEVILIPGAIPLTCIKFIYFENKEEKLLYESNAKTFSNLVFTDLKGKFKANYSKLINNMNDTTNISDELLNTIERQSNSQFQNKNNYSKAYAIGGALINSFYFTKNGSLSNSVFKYLVGVDHIEQELTVDLQQVINYLKNISAPSNRLLDKMYTGILDTISCSRDIKDNILEFLNTFIVEDTPEFQEKSQQRAKQLSKTLTDFELNPNKSASEFFNTAKSTVEKALFMLFLRESTDDFLEFNLDCFTEEDYLLYSILFGIRDGFINAPKDIKESTGIQLYLSEFMANYYHKSISSNISFTNIKNQPPLTLQDMFNKQSFKAWFAKHHKIDAVKYTFKLPKGEHQFNITSTGIEFTLDSEPKYSTVINEDIFSDAILSIHTSDYNKYFKEHNKIK
jgi:hypothetical protein